MANTFVDVALEQQWSDTSELTFRQALSDCTKLYSKLSRGNCNEATWQQATKYFDPFSRLPTTDLIENLRGEVTLLPVGDHMIPVLAPDSTYSNTYVCSPYGHYVQLPLESLYLMGNKLAQAGAKIFFRSLGYALDKCDINKVVYANHWLFSTDLYPQGFGAAHVEEVTKSLLERYPDRAIVFRSINDVTTAPQKAALELQGYSPIAARQIYISRPFDPAINTTRIIKSDLKLLRETLYEVVEGHLLTDAELDRILDLQIKLTVQHHSKLNPKITKKFLVNMIATDALHVFALKKDGVIDGVVGYIQKENMMFCPIFGFDKTHKEKNKIYRLLSTLLFTKARDNNLVFHQSAGASFYKTVRRSSPHIEYMYVYTKHLSKRQSFGWKTLQLIMNNLASPVMRKY